MTGLVKRLRESQAWANLLGEAPTFVEAIKNLPALAKSEGSVLISGETGTGKELVARSIHYLSDRAPYPFVPINCGSLPQSLLETELFGHERGAFTGAHARREGLIVQAKRGTLFLDEVGTLPEKAQVDLLRVLEDKKFRAVGSSEELNADVRIVAATNVPLERLIQSGSFREDLYFRLCVFSIAIPPLRARQEDILALAAHFLKKHTPTSKANLKLSPEAREVLLGHPWPGNVRELESAIIRGIHLSNNDLIQATDIGLRSAGSSSSAASVAAPGKMETFSRMKHEAIQRFEKAYLARLMSEHQGNVSQAAHTAGKERRNLGRLLKKHGLDRKSFGCP